MHLAFRNITGIVAYKNVRGAFIKTHLTKASKKKGFILPSFYYDAEFRCGKHFRVVRAAGMQDWLFFFQKQVPKWSVMIVRTKNVEPGHSSDIPFIKT